MKYNIISPDSREYRTPETAVMEFAGKNVILETSMIEDYEDNVIC